MWGGGRVEKLCELTGKLESGEHHMEVDWKVGGGLQERTGKGHAFQTDQQKEDYLAENTPYLLPPDV